VESDNLFLVMKITGTHINGLLVKEGLARVDRFGPKSKPDSQKKTEFEALKETEKEAREKHLNIWEHGDAGDSDDEATFQRFGI